MANYTQTKICAIEDSDFQSMIAELCHCVVLGKDQFVNETLFYLFMAIVRQKRTITKQHLPTDGILTRKVDKLPTDSVIYEVCREMVNQKRTHIESFDGKTVLTLIKQCYKAFCPPLSRSKKPTRREIAYQFQTELIKRRRKAGSL
jgi:hypothetical protein